MTDLDYLLIGKTGSGKSRTGNSILKRDLFVHKTSTASVTKGIQSEVSEYKGRIIKVVDCPGVGDTRLDNEEAVKLVMQAVADAIKINPSGYHAFLLVVRFGGRFTKEDTDTVQLLKSIFGEDFVKNFCILVVTCGDLFQAEDTEETFQEWCLNQEGVFKQLLDECQGRIVLFNNAAKSEGERDAQNDRLHELTAQLALQKHKFCNEHFQRAHKAREKAMVETKKPVLQVETLQKLSLISQKLEKLQQAEDDSGKRIIELKQLLKETEVLFSRIKDEDRGTDALHDMQISVKAMQASIREAIDVHDKVNKERAALKQQELEMEKKLAEKLEEEKKKFQKAMKEEKESWDQKEKAIRKAEEEKRRDMEKEFNLKIEKANKKVKQMATEVDHQRSVAESKSQDFWFGVIDRATQIGSSLFQTYLTYRGKK